MSRARLIRSIVARVGDYRQGEIPAIDDAHVDRWLSQFDAAVQVPILAELDHVLSKSYLRRSDFEAFFAEVVSDGEIVDDDPGSYWIRARFFNRPLRGNSQSAMLELFDAALQEECGLSINDCGDDGGPLVYVDDAIFTGMHVINDLEQIIPEASDHTHLVMVFYAVHREGVAYAQSELRKRFRAAGKSVNFTWRFKLELENIVAANSDVLWPKSVPPHDETRQYRASLTKTFSNRTGDSVGKNGFFSAGDSRHLLEQEFLKAGAVIRSQNANLNRYARPLGNRVLQSFGFGALIVTYRNCPNNCPLVFWAGDYPLFERDNN